MSDPVISFCIPTYNRANEVYECVTHILQHPSREIEVVVSNNASSDRTDELLKTISDPRLKYHRNTNNVQMIPNVAMALSISRADYSLLMSDEDRVILDAIDPALNFLRALPSEYTYVRFGMVGAYNIYRREDYSAPAGPEATGFVYFNSRDIAGNTYSRDVVRNLDVDEITRRYAGEEWKKDAWLHSSSLPSLSLHYTIKHPAYFSSIVLIERLEKFGGSCGEATILQEGSDGYSSSYYAPENAGKVFSGFADTVMRYYAGSGHEDYLLQSMLVAFFTDDFFTQIIGIFNSTIHGARRNSNIVLRKAFTEKWGTPWNAMVHMISEALKVAQAKTGGRLWKSVRDLLDGFLMGNLDMPLEGFTQRERDFAGNIIYHMGVKSTDLSYCPIDVPAFFEAEFMESHDQYIRFVNKQYALLISQPDMKTKRDYFLRGCAHLQLGRFEDAEGCFRIYLDDYDMATTLRQIIVGGRGRALAWWYLGFLRQMKSDFSGSAACFAKCHEVCSQFFCGDSLDSKRFEVLGFKLGISKARKKRLKEYRQDKTKKRRIAKRNRQRESEIDASRSTGYSETEN